MKRAFQFSIAAAAAGAVSVSLVAQSAPELNFDANADFLQLPSFGEVAGVATNSKGQVFVYARTGHAVATLGDERTFYHGGSRLFQFDQSGKFVREIGQGVYGVNFAQQVRVDPQDNVWIVDAGSNQVFKFDTEGRLALVLGRKPESIPVRAGAGVPARDIDVPKGGAAGGEGGRGGAPGGGGGGRGRGGAPGTGTPGDIFSRPSDVTWDRAGNIYVADGYGANNRVVKLTRDGNFVKTWGQTGSAQGQFNGVRGIAADAAGNIYVADAGNSRIQVFDGEGTFKSQITNVGSPQALCISSGATQYLYASNSNDPESMDNGEIYKLQLNGQIIGKFGRAGKLAKEFGTVNAIDCRTENDLMVGEVLNWRVQKLTLRR
jgi:DNA-binding beta-propeller fold protein YncE